MLPRLLRTVFLGTLLVSGAHSDVINRLVPRQATDTGIVVPDTTSKTSDAASTFTVTTTDDKSTSTIVSTRVTTSTSVASSSTSTAITTTATSTTVSSTTSTLAPSTTTTSKASSTNVPTTVITSASQSQLYTTVVVTTGGGSTWSFTSTGSSSSTSSTAAPITDSSATSGLDANTRKTVIGVVCGVGGAIFLALIFLVVWKLWGRRRVGANDDDGLMMDSNLEEKTDGKRSLNPFKSTLESYHNPSSRPVNASSNF